MVSNTGIQSHRCPQRTPDLTFALKMFSVRDRARSSEHPVPEKLRMAGNCK